MKLFRKEPEDLRNALGQCFWIGINGAEFNDSETKKIFDEFQPGGVILFQRNVGTLEQVRQLNSDLQRNSSIPLFIAIDQEGGLVERLHELIGSIPPAMAIAAARNHRLARRIHRSHARLLRSLGFNVNFTPVLDLALTSSDNGLGTRCFSDQPKLVVQCARDVIEGHADASVLICGKHFPGLGDTNLDSHVDLPTVSRSWKRLSREDLYPYKKLLSKLPFIMVNHALYPDKNQKLPASLAKEIVKDFLLDDWNYPGISISDDLIMGAVSRFYNLPEASERALLAGNHMFLICKPEGVVRTFKRLLSRAVHNERLAQMIFRNSSRILQTKFHMLKDTQAEISTAKEIKHLAKYSAAISERAITPLRKQTIGKRPAACTIFLPHTKWLKGEKSSLGADLSKRGSKITEIFYPISLSEEEAINTAGQSQTDWNIVVVTAANRHAGQKRLINELLKKGKR
ncbi:MAG: hypothetical protein C5B54_03355, partial [Acidobacteria bacterium]